MAGLAARKLGAPTGLITVMGNGFSKYSPPASMARTRMLTSIPPLHPAGVRSVGFLPADQQDGAYRLEIASIRAVGEGGITQQD